MCLITNEPEQIADKDIVCYKVLKVSHGSNKCTYFTPYQNKRVFLNKNLLAYGKEEIEEHSFSFKSIGEGFIHVYSTLERARKYLSNNEKIIVKCIIRKGTRYYSSYYLYQEYCAKKVFITNEIMT